jgi:hypothetical protein
LKKDHPSGAKVPTDFAGLSAPFDFAQGRLEVVPFHGGFELAHCQTHLSIVCAAFAGIKWRTRKTVTQARAEREVEPMLGDKIGEVKGKRLVRRVISVDPPTAEVTFEDSGKMLGVAVNGMGTYTSVVRADGSIHGSGQGMNMTDDGEAVTWTGTGTGHFGPGGSVSYRGMLFFRTTSKKLARLNNACGAFEYEVDAKGGTVSKIWEWK